MRIMIIDVDGLKIEVPMTIAIGTLAKSYNELKEMESEMNIIEYKESE